MTAVRVVLQERLDALVEHYQNSNLRDEFGPWMNRVSELASPSKLLTTAQADFVFNYIVQKVRNSARTGLGPSERKGLTDDEVIQLLICINGF